MTAARRIACGGTAAVLAAALIAAAATAGQPQRKYTAAGNAAAKAITLKRSDLPAGWKKTKGGGGGSSSVTCPSFDPDQSDLTTVGHADTAFEDAQGLGNVASIVGIFSTPAQGRTSWTRIVKPPLLGCMASFLEGSAANGTTIKVVSKGPLRLAVPGKRHAAYRIVANVTSGNQRAKVYLDLILQGAGPANSVMIVTSVLAAPSAAVEAKIARAVARRLPA